MRDPSGGFFFARPAFCDVSCWHFSDLTGRTDDVCSWERSRLPDCPPGLL